MTMRPSQVTDRYWVYTVNPEWRPISQLVGMWVMAVPAEDLDGTWTSLQEAVMAGKLPAARARTRLPNRMGLDDRYRIICAFTSGTSVHDVDYVRDVLRNLGFRLGLRYVTVPTGDIGWP